jgi:hypothetical protein
MQDSNDINQLDSDVRAHLDQQYEQSLQEEEAAKATRKWNLPAEVTSSTFLGQFDSVEALKASLTEDHYDDSKFALVGDEIVLIFNVKENTGFNFEMVSYRNKQGGLISKDESYQKDAEVELARLCGLPIDSPDHWKTAPEAAPQHNLADGELVDAAGLATAAAAMAPGLGDDVKFTEASPFDAPGAEAAVEFLPLEFLIAALKSAGVDEGFISKVEFDTHPDAGRVEVPEAQRIFLVNRALRLAISEVEHEDTIQVRMLISDKVSAENWRQIIVKGVIPAIKGTLPMRKAK